MEKLAETIHMSKSTVFRAIKELEELGLVSVKHRGFDETNEYTLYVPQDLIKPGNQTKPSNKEQSPGNDRSTLTDGCLSDMTEEENRVFKKTKKEKKNGTKEKKENLKADCGYAAPPLTESKDSITETPNEQLLLNGPSTTPPKSRPYLTMPEKQRQDIGGIVTSTEPIKVTECGRFDHIFEKRPAAEKEPVTTIEPFNIAKYFDEHDKRDKGLPTQCCDIGTHECSCALLTPKHMTDRGSIGCKQFREKTCVDRCLLYEIPLLWAHGITTTGSCCGHNKQQGYIGVTEEDVPKMEWLGYVLCDGRSVDFVPKSSFPYEPSKTTPSLEPILEKLWPSEQFAKFMEDDSKDKKEQE